MAEGNETHLDPENTDDTPPAPQAKQETTPHSIDNETDQQNAAADIFETTISCSNQDSLVDQKIEQTETAPRAGENLEKAENIPISHKEVSDSISPQDQSLKTQADETGDEPSTLNVDTRITQKLDTLTSALTTGFHQIQASFDKKLAYDSTKQQQIDSLHKKLQEYQSDLIAKTNRPLVNGLIQMRADLSKRIDRFQDNPDIEVSREKFLDSMRGIQDDIDVLLDQNGVFAFTNSGEVFNPTRQRLVKGVTTTDPELVGQIVKRLRPGYEQSDVIVQNEGVSVYVAEKNHKPPPLEDNKIPTTPSDSESPTGSSEQDNTGNHPKNSTQQESTK